MKPWTAEEILTALIKAHLAPITFANLVEFEMPTDEAAKYSRRIDLLTICVNGGKLPWTAAGNLDRYGNGQISGHVPGGYRIAFEIKTSLADFQREQRDPYKQDPVHRIVNEFYYVMPQGTLRQHKYGFDGIPHRDGLIEVYRDPRTRWKGTPRLTVSKRALMLMHPETPLWFTNYLAHRTLYGNASGGELAVKRRRTVFTAGRPEELDLSGSSERAKAENQPERESVQ